MTLEGGYLTTRVKSNNKEITEILRKYQQSIRKQEKTARSAIVYFDDSNDHGYFYLLCLFHLLCVFLCVAGIAIYAVPIGALFDAFGEILGGDDEEEEDGDDQGVFILTNRVGFACCIRLEKDVRMCVCVCVKKKI